MALIGLLGFVGLIVGLVWLVVALIFKKEKKKPIITLVVGLIALIVGMVNTSSSDSKEDASDKASSSETTTTTTVESKTKESTTEKSTSSSKSDDADLDAINKEIATHLEQNKGWALGTIDENANPIENGEPNPDYAIWPYVNSITYTGKDLEVQVTADFLDFSDSEKEQVASSAQGIAMSYGLLEERPHVYIYNGENAYGRSTVLDATKYKWYD